MKEWLLMLALTNDQGLTQIEIISKHKSLISCKAQQLSHINVKNRINYYCQENKKKNNNITFNYNINKLFL